MLRTSVRSTEFELEGHRYQVEYFEQQTVRGGRRYSCEIVLGDRDRIILDDDSLAALESKIERLVPATIHSRLLAGGPPVAA